MGLLYGHTGCLTTKNGGFRPGQWRGYKCRKYFLAVIVWTVAVQTEWRRSRQRYTFVRQKVCVDFIAKSVRGWRTRRILARERAAVFGQKLWRGKVGRRYAELLKNYDAAVVSCQSMWRRAICQKRFSQEIQTIKEKAEEFIDRGFLAGTAQVRKRSSRSAGRTGTRASTRHTRAVRRSAVNETASSEDAARQELQARQPSSADFPAQV